MTRDTESLESESLNTEAERLNYKTAKAFESESAPATSDAIVVVRCLQTTKTEGSLKIRYAPHEGGSAIVNTDV